MTERVVTLIDMDCFYCQVESRENPDLRGKPAAVVQYNAWKGGGIIAVNYEARAKGVTRNMRGDEAKEKCPDIVLVKVPEVRGKADLSKYRNAGKEVIQVLLEFGGIVERASVDEAYVDLTRLVEERSSQNLSLEDLLDNLSNTFVVGHDEREEDRAAGLKEWLTRVFEEDLENEMKLVIGALIVEEMRARVYEKTQFRCSAGIAHNKTISKFACGIHKPNKQTILPHDKVENLFRTLKVTKLRGLGGKLGDSVAEDLNCKTLYDLSQLSMKDIRNHFDEKTSSWLYNISRGICHEPVKERDLPKSIGCSKNFRGPEMLDTREKVETWIRTLCEEVSERLCRDREDNNRQAKGLHISVSSVSKGAISRAGPLHSYDVEKLARQAILLIAKANEAPPSDKITWKPKLCNIGVSASKFEELTQASTSSIANFFQKRISSDETRKESSSSFILDESVARDDYTQSGESGQITKSEIEGMSTKTQTSKMENSPSISSTRQPLKATNFFSNSNNLKRAKNQPSDQQEIAKPKPLQETEDSYLLRQVEAMPSTSPENARSNTDSGDSVTAEELVPNLEAFDPSILELLPLKLKKLVEERVQYLKSRPPAVEKEKNKNPTSKRADEVADHHRQQEELLEFDDEGEEDGGNVDDLETCEKCGRRVSPFEMPEHLDFHVAQELQEEMKHEPISVRTVFVNNGDKSGKIGSKRKQKNDGHDLQHQQQLQHPTKKQKNIMSFFQKKD